MVFAEVTLAVLHKISIQGVKQWGAVSEDTFWVSLKNNFQHAKPTLEILQLKVDEILITKIYKL